LIHDTYIIAAKPKSPQKSLLDEELHPSRDCDGDDDNILLPRSKGRPRIF